MAGLCSVATLSNPPGAGVSFTKQTLGKDWNELLLTEFHRSDKNILTMIKREEECIYMELSLQKMKVTTPLEHNLLLCNSCKI